MGKGREGGRAGPDATFLDGANQGVLHVPQSQQVDDVIHNLPLGRGFHALLAPQPSAVGQVLPHCQVLVQHVVLHPPSPFQLPLPLSFPISFLHMLHLSASRFISFLLYFYSVFMTTTNTPPLSHTSLSFSPSWPPTPSLLLLHLLGDQSCTTCPSLRLHFPSQFAISCCSTMLAILHSAKMNSNQLYCQTNRRCRTFTCASCRPSVHDGPPRENQQKAARLGSASPENSRWGEEGEGQA